VNTRDSFVNNVSLNEPAPSLELSNFTHRPELNAIRAKPLDQVINLAHS
jgi:hypothetical protein